MSARRVRSRGVRATLLCVVNIGAPGGPVTGRDGDERVYGRKSFVGKGLWCSCQPSPDGPLHWHPVCNLNRSALPSDLQNPGQNRLNRHETRIKTTIP